MSALKAVDEPAVTGPAPAAVGLAVADLYLAIYHHLREYDELNAAQIAFSLTQLLVPDALGVLLGRE